MKSVRKPLKPSPKPDSTLSVDSLSPEGKSLYVHLMQTLGGIEEDTEEARLNETSMSDNNGKRIIYTIIEDQKKKK